ncbi:ribosome biogenesis GTPase Der [Desulfovibrio cuneatus]|uniref:ribosome biogenesis GTPase Der n=1 Tax=Desulfovibrio cuneatus TaxID=159728 RepID=UPI0004294F59|nr:ribosome biogenesis GTPase Der [Desulfovibrio cuneatus]
MSSAYLPQVALLGRPNVGKSTLFNRLIRSNRAITHDRAGITRDRMEGVVKRRGREPFILVDTGGVTLDAAAKASQGPVLLRGFEEDILRQAKEAVAEASLLCLVVDGRDGLTPLDRHLADFLRKVGKPLLLVVNKIDGAEKADILLAEFHNLGMELVPCSAAHGFNMMELEEFMRERVFPDGDEIPEPEDKAEGEAEEEAENAHIALVASEDELEILDGEEDEEGTADAAAESEEVEGEPGYLRLALLGRPNAGKSSLVNALTGRQRMIVSDTPGTTRDSVDVHTMIDGEPCTFVDTAGVRRRSKIADTVERYSVNSSIKSTTKAHVTLMVVGADEGLTQQDKRLIDLLVERRTPFMLLVNKWDLVDPAARKEKEKDYRQALVFCPHVPLLFISAAKDKNLQKIVPLAKRIFQECSLRIGTGVLNRSLETVLQTHQAPMVKGVRPKFFYMTQAETSPPTFVFFVNNADLINDAYSRYLERGLRKMFGIEHAPMRMHFRSSHKKKAKK